jgi:predicted unusual protein kinase regulating ubiquinone biosynthesis (AarF/ABC1/UbiB family)
MAGRLSRLGKLGSLATRVTTSYVGDRIRAIAGNRDGSVHQRNAERVVETLGKLKGAAMKMGQAASMAARHLDLPDEVLETLGKLHDRAEPVPFETIRRTIEAELDLPLDEAFATFDPEPLGTASLAQAHAATLPDGTDVVVKVLHEGVDEAAETDLLALRAFLTSGRALGRTKEEVDDIFDEVQARLLEELDYLQEAANLHQFGQAFAGDPNVVVPRTHAAWCTERVLTMDRLYGVSLDAFLEMATAEQRQVAGDRLAQLFFDMAFRHRLLHADPHPGNFLFLDDGRIGLIDFGCMKRLDRYWMGHYASAVIGALDGDRDRLLTACREIGAWVGDNPSAGQAIVDFCDTLVAPWRDGAYTIGASTDDMAARMGPVSQALWQFPDVRGPSEIVFLHRTLVGFYTFGRELVVTGHWGERLRDAAQLAVDNARD